MNIEKKREFEKQIVCEMIDLYYKKHNDPKEGEALKAYALGRIAKCPMMETKTFCSQCPIHCYQKEKREQIRQVMRWSGPRMLFHHPIMALRHVWYSKKDKLAKPFFLTIGCLGVVLAVIGAILPLIPAFPFALMAAFGFARSSEKLHERFVNSKLYKDNCQDWVKSRSKSGAAKKRVLGTISLMMLFGFVMMKRVPVAQMILFLVWLGHVLYFRYGIKTLPANREAV